jgi:hypothetical protein
MLEEMLSYSTLAVHYAIMICETEHAQTGAECRAKVTAFAPLSVTLVTISTEIAR